MSDATDQDHAPPIALPSHIAGSGTLDRLVETARDYARAAASENTLKAYAKDWVQFARWCRMRRSRRRRRRYGGITGSRSNPAARRPWPR